MNQQEIEKTELETVVELWKKNNIKEVVLTFDCGGDSMGRMDWEIFTDKGKFDGEDRDEILNYFEEPIFNKVEFYECSDGEYMGESGTVSIVLDDEGEFDYFKDATSEYNYTEEQVMKVELSDEEVEFIEEYVSNINGGEGSTVTIFKKDFIITEEQEKLVQRLEGKIDEEACEHDFEFEGEWNDWYSYTTDIEGNQQIKLIGNTLQLEVRKSFYVYESND